MKIFITKTFKGKEAGKSVKEYVAGSTYDIECADLIKVITDQGWGELGVIAELLGEQTVAAAETENTGEYAHTAQDILVMPMKELRAIIDAEALAVETKGKKQPELAQAVIDQLKLKYKGL